MNRLVLWVAQGFGSGRAPAAPGTFGSLVGLGWFAALLAPGSTTLYLTGTLLGIAASVWLCGAAERILGQKDPGSVVLDEIVALPVCFGVSLFLRRSPGGQIPDWHLFLSSYAWLEILAVFVTFRFFDIAKPWPIRQIQSLPAGWGVTADDVLAAIYVNGCAVAWALLTRP